MKIGYATSAVLLLAALLIGLPPPAMGNSVAEMGKCTKALVALSPCLPYVASPPNDLSSSPSTSCCRSFRASASIHSSSENRSEICLCVILRNPFVFGFPVNTTRITSLVSLCHLKTRRKTPDAYLRSLCIDSGAPPPQSHDGSSALPPVGSPRSFPTSPPPQEHNGSSTLPPVGSPIGSRTSPPPQNHNGSSALPPAPSPIGSPTSPAQQNHNQSSTLPPMLSPAPSGSKAAPHPKSSSLEPSKNSSRPTTMPVRNSSCRFFPGFTMLFLAASMTFIITTLAQHSS